MNNKNGKPRDRAYQVSSNRGRSSHKLRYVEATAPSTDDCRLCVGSIADVSAASTNDRSATAQGNGEFSRHEDR